MKLEYLPRLDGIRALAVIGVLITHFMWFYEPIRAMELGRTGVRLFFVLSGFLITRILLDYRDRMSTGEAAKQFYWRRFLRLAPPFYLAIIVSAALGIANMRNDWPIHFLYLSNFLFAWRGTSEPVGHLWSLAVEEQFYLVWFAIVVWLPRRFLMPAMLFAIVAAPIFRYFTADWPGRPAALTPAVIDCLALGALIGWASLNNGRIFRFFANWGALCLSFSALVVTIILYPHPVILGTLQAVFSACFVALAAAPRTLGLDWLRVAPLTGLGKISYGIYLYHGFLTPYLHQMNAAGFGFLRSALLISASIIIAALSWVLIEKPALRLKDRLPRQAVDRSRSEIAAAG